LEFWIGAGVTENQNDGAFRWSKKFSDRFSRFDTIPECDSQPPSHVAVAITLNAKASSLKTVRLRDKLTIGKPDAIYRMVPLSITSIDLNRDLKVAIFYDIEYRRSDMR